MTHLKTLSEAFRQAAKDYLLLVERDYARGSALKLVGDRYQLTSVQRSILYRGISSAHEAESRSAKQTVAVTGLRVHVDALNVLYTLANYLYGRVVFISTDGWVRDAGEAHGRKTPSPAAKRGTLFEAALVKTFDWLAERRPSCTAFYIDEPVSMSGLLAVRLRKALVDAALEGKVSTVPSADFILKRIEDGVVATSDSTIIDCATRPVCDMAHEILTSRFSPELIDLRELVRGGAK
ncbi:MAG TPA: DUF434 domain-containing protein [Spirochaetia bacterium]|nr:DUF434 domain-containing protein [Spirochaetia bacterium]